MERFIKACVSVLPKKWQDIYYKYEEKWLYLVFGGLTTVVSIVTKLIAFAAIPGEAVWEESVVVTISWICSVTFAFFPNKKYVFKNETKTKKEFWKVFFSFYGSRLATFFMEQLIFFVFCTWLDINEVVITFASQVLIFIANYVLSKFFVFRNKDKSASVEETNG